MKIKGVIFDLDGVITDTAEYHYIAWKDLANKIGIDIGREFNETLKGISRGESLERILEKGNKAEFYTNEQKEELAKYKNDYYLTLLERLTPNDIMDNIEETLLYLKENDIKIALASASKNAPLILEKLQLREYFEVIVDPASVKTGKPSPDIFLEGAKLMNLNPKECIGVEDSEAGVIAINDSNMLSIGIGSEENLGHAKIIIPNTSRLKETIEKIEQKQLT
ncbi:beta-phosphoglucomutase [Clostridioides sp. ES-S-0108-01]|uniref:beta-phosphoglucomutase n=1 Tax=Clostridioides sp. ES-S-0108-01 TaxID=2770773 RepID=UPI001D0CD9B3|nr:beta-phosphoglucomutase [Clostridioides sp. ES-S-0108-01]UDN52851.1 beta-phosphoglucomutase [Clostridioides sp. ES-S-0107-01]